MRSDVHEAHMAEANYSRVARVNLQAKNSDSIDEEH